MTRSKTESSRSQLLSIRETVPSHTIWLGMAANVEDAAPIQSQAAIGRFASRKMYRRKWCNSIENSIVYSKKSLADPYATSIGSIALWQFSARSGGLARCDN